MRKKQQTVVHNSWQGWVRRYTIEEINNWPTSYTLVHRTKRLDRLVYREIVRDGIHSSKVE
jgi:hypothetical protein